MTVNVRGGFDVTVTEPLLHVLERKTHAQQVACRAVPKFMEADLRKPMLRAFSTLGKQVYYIYAYPCREENIPDMEFPVCAHKSIESIGIKYLERRVHPGDLAIFELPFAGFEAYLDCAKAHGAYTVYEQIDNWDTSLGAMFYREELFGRYLEKADLITVTAKNLGEKIAEKSSRPYLYLPNAVNIEIFEPAKEYVRTADLATGIKTLLYFGSLWGIGSTGRRSSMLPGRSRTVRSTLLAMLTAAKTGGNTCRRTCISSV